MFINLTKHPVDVVSPWGAPLFRLPQNGEAIRCATVLIDAGMAEHENTNIPLKKKIIGQLNYMPPKLKGVLYIVSSTAAQAAWAQGRDDFVCIGEPFIKDGRKLGTALFCVNPRKEEQRHEEK